MNEIGTLATGIWEHELDSTSSTTVEPVSGWLESNVGRINVLIDSDFSACSGMFVPSGTFKAEEDAIYTQLYLMSYYGRKAANTLRGIDGGDDFISLSEGDMRIQRANRGEVAKTYLALKREARETLDKLVAKYSFYLAKPRQVHGYDADLIVASNVHAR